MPKLNNAFIIIHVRQKRYAKYVDGVQVNVWHSDQLLGSQEVEDLRSQEHEELADAGDTGL